MLYIFFINKKKENVEVLARLKKFNEGILGQSFDDIEGGKIGDLCLEIHQATQNTRHLVGELSIASEQLRELCKKFSAETDESAISSQEIAKTVTDIAERAEKQVAASGTAVNEIQNLSEHSNLIASETKKVVSGNITVQKSLQETFNMIENLVNSIEITSKENSAIAEKFQFLKEIRIKLTELLLQLKNRSTNESSGTKCSYRSCPCRDQETVCCCRRRNQKSFNKRSRVGK